MKTVHRYQAAINANCGSVPQFLHHIVLPGLLTLVMAGSSATAGPAYDLDRKQLEAVITDLKAWLPGAWDSYPQIWYERNVHMPAEGEHEHWHRTFALINAPQVGEVVFYGQINLGGRDGPIVGRSQVLYKAVIDEDRGVVSITGQSPADAQLFENLHQRPELWSEVRMRDEAAVRCDFIWRRDGRQLVGVLEGKTPERRKYGPGTCTYIAGSGDEFFADAQWVLSPDELWLYDINTMRGIRFIGREDRSHMRLYRATPYRCTITAPDETDSRQIDAHDRGYTASVRAGNQRELVLQLLRAWYPATGGFGLDDQLRLTLTDPASEQLIGAAIATPLANSIRLQSNGIETSCERQTAFPPMD